MKSLALADRPISQSVDDLLAAANWWVRKAGGEDEAPKAACQLARGLGFLARAVDLNNIQEHRTPNIALLGALVEELRRCDWMPAEHLFFAHGDVIDPMLHGGTVPRWASLRLLSIIDQASVEHCLWPSRRQVERVARDRDGRGRAAA